MQTVLEQPPAAERIDYSEREQTALTVARSLVARGPTWVEFFREIFGVGGLLKRLCPTPAELDAFRLTRAYAELDATLVELRNKDRAKEPSEPTRVITVRLPKSLHELLLADAHQRHTSMNQLCITRLLQLTEATTDQ